MKYIPYFSATLFVIVIFLAKGPVVLAQEYSRITGFDKHEVQAGEEFTLFGENLRESGIKTCSNPDPSAPKAECPFVVEVIFARKIGRTITNDRAQIISVTPTATTVRVPVVPSGDYLIYYNHKEPETQRYSMINRDFGPIKVINNIPITPPPTTTPQPTETVSPTPFVSASPDPEATSGSQIGEKQNSPGSAIEKDGPDENFQSLWDKIKLFFVKLFKLGS